jgi:myo-inositol-1(or 4)-monophosphatase
VRLTFSPVGSSLAAMIDLDKALLCAQKAAQLGREVLLDYFGQPTNVSEKFQAGLVSEADVESERVISSYLRCEYPEIDILGEEDSYKKQGEGLETSAQKKNLWMIDPLDGTTNYIHKFPIYCVSIGLLFDGELAVGVCDVPGMRMVYSARRGGGAYCNGKQISVSQRRTFSESLLATGFSSLEPSQHQLEIFSALINKSRGIRRAGSAAYDLCLVAEGVFDGYWERGLSAWDTAAGALIVREAGGKISTFDGDAFSPFDSTIVAGNLYIQPQLKAHIQKYSK